MQPEISLWCWQPGNLLTLTIKYTQIIAMKTRRRETHMKPVEQYGMCMNHLLLLLSTAPLLLDTGIKSRRHVSTSGLSLLNPASSWNFHSVWNLNVYSSGSIYPYLNSGIFTDGRMNEMNSLKALINTFESQPNFMTFVLIHLCCSPVLDHVGFLVLTEVVMKNYIFWNTTPRSQLKVNRRFEGTCSVHLQSWGVSQASMKHCLLPFAWLTRQPGRWRRHVPSKCRLTFNGLQGAISQKIEILYTALFGSHNVATEGYLFKVRAPFYVKSWSSVW
jgi:hypothetical protein